MVKWGIEALWISITPPFFLCVYLNWVVHGFECSCCQPDKTSTFLSFCIFNLGKKRCLCIWFICILYLKLTTPLYLLVIVFYASNCILCKSTKYLHFCTCKFPLRPPLPSSCRTMLLLSPWRHNTLPEEAVTPKYKHTLLKTQNTKA